MIVVSEQRAMSEMPLISVVIPTYNRERSVVRASMAAVVGAGEGELAEAVGEAEREN